jgi:adenylate cyclase class 2
LNDCDVEVDEWPGIPTYIEIEWPSTEKVKETLAVLGYQDNETTSDNTTKIYRRYGIEDLEAIEILSFESMA